MKASSEDKKQQEFQHIISQYKTYKLYYNARPIIQKHILTYIEFTQFITQLIPAYSAHYYPHLNHTQHTKLVEITLNLFQDILNKLKNISNRLQLAEGQKHRQSNYEKLDICKICLHGLREAEVQNSKQSLNKNELLMQTIMKTIRQVQNEKDVFDKDEDINFFRELKLALEKKSQTIQICRSESIQFTNVIEEEIKELLNMRRNIFIQNQTNVQSKQLKKGNELQQEVTESYGQTFKQKLPAIVKIIEERLKKKREVYLREHCVNAEAQTSNFESMRISDMKRKIAALEGQVGTLKTEKSHFEWQAEEKGLLSQKLQKQLLTIKQQLHEGTMIYQREIKTLQLKNIKLKDEFDRLKQKREVQFRNSNERSMLTHKKMNENNQVLIHVEETLGVTSDLMKREDSPQRKRRKKEGTLLLIKSNSKIILPTIKKITTETSLINEKSSFLSNLINDQEQLNQAAQQQPQSINGLPSSAFDALHLQPAQSKSIQRSDKKKNTVNNASQNKKKGENKKKSSNQRQSNQLNGIDQPNQDTKPNMTGQKNQQKKPNKTNQQNKSSTTKFDNIKTQRKNMNSEVGRLTHKQSLPKINNTHQERKTFYEKSNEDGQQNDVVDSNQNEKESLISAVEEVNKIMRLNIQNKIEKSSSFNSEKASSTKNNKSHDKTKKDSIYKALHQQSKKDQIQDQDQEACYKQDFEQRQFADLKKKEKKNFLVNSFQKIKEEIDMQSFVTSEISNQTPSHENSPKVINSLKEQLKQIVDSLISKEVQDNDEQEQQLNNLFISCIKLLKSKEKLAKLEHSMMEQNKDMSGGNGERIVEIRQKRKSINLELMNNLKQNMHIKGLLSKQSKQENMSSRRDNHQQNRSHQDSNQQNRAHQEEKKCNNKQRQYQKPRDSFHSQLNRSRDDGYKNLQAQPTFSKNSYKKKERGQQCMSIIGYSKTITSEDNSHKVSPHHQQKAQKQALMAKEIKLLVSTQLDGINIKQKSSKAEKDVHIKENRYILNKNYSNMDSKDSIKNSSKNSRDYMNVKPSDYVTEYTQNEQIRKEFKTVVESKSQIKRLKKRIEDHLEEQRKTSFNICISHNISKIQTSHIHDHEEIINKNRHNKLKTQTEESSLVKLENTLFVSDQIAYNYEMNFSKKKAKIHTLQPQFLEYAKDLFEKLQRIKISNPHLYMSLCSYFRYPYSNSQNKLLHLDIIKSINFYDFIHCLQQILPFHRKCKFDKNECLHLQRFKKVLNEYIKEGSTV